MSDNNLDQLRHSAAHLLAAAVLELYPDTQLAIGPSIEDGFYYDFDFKEPLSDTQLPKIEKKMQQLIKTWNKFERIKLDQHEALNEFKNNPYKTQLIEDLIKQDQELTVYQSGKFRDLCRGGHLDDPKQLKHFKLQSIAGAYWRGDEKNKMLTRIYGTAFFSQEELDQHLKNLEEAKNRDHKKLGRELDLFTFSELVGSGLPLWTPKGMLLRSLLDDFVWQLRSQRGYQRVEIPHITKKDLYEVSGHWDKFKDELFKIKTREGHLFAMKPMNCPHHTQIYARKNHSYRELPVRFANTTMVYRDEQTGELSGLSRVRSITQDDAHVFCRRSQIQAEMNAVWDIIDAFYQPIGFDLKVRLSLSDPKTPDRYLGTREEWQAAEDQLRELAHKRGVTTFDAIGEAAFYGPKIDFIAKDSLNREWQVATIQLDMNMPKRFKLTCTNEQGEAETIYMIHCAIMGSIERYVSILIEHFGGAFPLWLAPVQVALLPLNDQLLEYANKLADALKAANIRFEIHSDDSLGKRIRGAQLQKIPAVLIIGEKERSTDSVSLRLGNEDKGQLKFADFLAQTTKKIEDKSLI